MEIIRKPLGLYKTNCYILVEDKKALIIDPGFHGKQIIKELQGLTPLAILITHGHADHICAVDEIVDVFAIPVYMNGKDDELLRVKRRMPSAYKERFHAPYHDLSTGELTIGPFQLKIQEMPGHSEGSVFITYQNIIFTGDTLLKDAVGKTNTYNGSEEKLERTIQTILEMDGSYAIFPGHGSSSALGREQKENIFLKKLQKVIKK